MCSSSPLIVAAVVETLVLLAHARFLHPDAAALDDFLNHDKEEKRASNRSGHAVVSKDCKPQQQSQTDSSPISFSQRAQHASRSDLVEAASREELLPSASAASFPMNRTGALREEDGRDNGNAVGQETTATATAAAAAATAARAGGGGAGVAENGGGDGVGNVHGAEEVTSSPALRKKTTCMVRKRSQGKMHGIIGVCKCGSGKWGPRGGG